MSIIYYDVKLNDVIPKLKQILERDSRIKIAVIFGSILYEGPVRDIDVAVYSNPPLSLKEVLLLSDELERAINVPVDLVPLDRVDPRLQYRILMEGLPIVVKDRNLYDKLVLLALGQIQDMEIKLRMQPSMIVSLISLC